MHKDPEGLEYYTQDFPTDQPPIMPLCEDDSCECRCLLKVVGLQTAAGAGIAGSGLPTQAKPFAPRGATGSTSIASQAASAVFGKSQLPVRLPAPTYKNPGAMTKSVARFAGRWAPGLGWLLLGYDAYRVKKCIEEECQGDDCKK